MNATGELVQDLRQITLYLRLFFTQNCHKASGMSLVDCFYGVLMVTILELDIFSPYSPSFMKHKTYNERKSYRFRTTVVSK